MGKNCLLNISEVKGLKYTPNNLFFTNVPDKKSTKIFLSYMTEVSMLCVLNEVICMLPGTRASLHYESGGQGVDACACEDLSAFSLIIKHLAPSPADKNGTTPGKR